MDTFDLKIATCLIFIKIGNQYTSNMLIMNILIGIDDLDQNLRNLVPKLKWNLALKQIEHAYYEYNTTQCLERSHDYRLTMIEGSNMELIALFNTMLKVIKTCDIVMKCYSCEIFRIAVWRKTWDGHFWHYMGKTINLCSRKVAAGTALLKSLSAVDILF